MAKFVIECPNCGRYAQARSGFFARKRIDCSCGHVINVRTEKLIGRKCPHCGNHVVFDQSKGDKAKCPVCHGAINDSIVQGRTVEFSCAQCGVRYHASPSEKTFTCPVCDHVNNIAERLKQEEIKHDGLASIIKYEGDAETLVWKHPIEDFNMGSQLIVHESQEAIFFKDGQALDLFGSGRYTLETQQLPMMEKLYKLPTDTEGTFHSEVYFINMATQMGVKWGTDTKVRFFDTMTGMHVSLGASGNFNIRIVNSRKFLLKVVGTTGGFKQSQIMGNGSGMAAVGAKMPQSLENKGYFRSIVMTQVKSYLASSMKEKNISVFEVDERLLELSEALRDRINPYLADYGLEMSEFYIERVLTPDDDPDFIRAKKQFAERYLEVRQRQINTDVARAEMEQKLAEAETASRLKIIEAQAAAEAEKIKAAGSAEAYRLQATAEAEEMRMKGYTYQQETARQVGMEAMQNGITGNGAGGGLGEIAGLGITLGAMGSVVNMTRDVLNPVVDTATQSAKPDGWTCTRCNQTNITTNFCPNCGAQKPQAGGWTCPQCGQANITTNFCPHCGTKKPSAGWDCPNCGHKEIASNFCPDCGCQKPSPSWNCPDCGRQGIEGNFCPDCGRRKG